LSPRARAQASPAKPVLADQEGLGETVGRGLGGIVDADAVLRAVTEQAAELRQVLRGGDQQQVADAGEQQGRQRIVDHRLVVDGEELLRGGEGGGVQAGAGAAGEDDALADHAAVPRRWPA
jgi:hypothetical protein